MIYYITLRHSRKLILKTLSQDKHRIEAGTLKLVGTSEEMVYNETKKLLTDNKEYKKMSKASNPYGDGTTSKQIVDHIINKFI